VAFRNSHLSYAVTWFALALMSALFGLRLAGVRPFAGTLRARP
jgi:cytochrome oxidase assembly protein ShyY1